MNLQEYFQSYQGYFWEWDKETDASVGTYNAATMSKGPDTLEPVFESISIPDGSTIAYESYAIELLEHLSDDGMPPFGALLMAIIATNPGGKEAVTNIIAAMKDTFMLAGNVQDNAALFLNHMAILPDQFKKGDGRKQLFQLIFSGCHNGLSAANAKKIIQAYNSQRQQLSACGEKLRLNPGVMLRDFRTLDLMNEAFPDLESILSKLNGLPQLTDIPVEMAETPDEGSPDLVRDLTQDNRTFPVGSLIKRLWSGLTLPMHHFASGRQPLGGISDLANKGDFDKLLISEFANDDDVFMSRLANNEALYTEREVPPENDKFTRVLLIDTSLKNWGTPKVLAYAAAIAVATHPKTNIVCRLFAIGESVDEVFYANTDDIIAGLNILSPTLDASSGLAAFFKSDIMKAQPEIFIISSAASQKMPDFLRLMNEYHDNIKYIIEPDFTGNINFYRIQNKGRSLLQHLYLPLEELWKSNAGAKQSGHSKSKKHKQAPLPDYPILYPLRSAEIARFYLDESIYVLAANKSLLQTVVNPDYKDYQNRYTGCRLLLENLSVKTGGIHALGREGEDYILVSYFKQSNIISYHNLTTSEYIKAETGFAASDNFKLYAISPNGQLDYVWLFSGDVSYSIKKSGQKLLVEDVAQDEGAVIGYNFSVKQIQQLNYRPGSNILQNYLPVCIDKDKKLRLNKHELKLQLSDNEAYCNIQLRINRVFEPLINAKYNSKQNINVFEFPDGSTVSRDKNGIFTLKSGNAAIPAIYVPTSLEYPLGMATDTEFAGNDYFYDEEKALHKIGIAAFNDKYLTPFIQNIIDHGA